jgi:hypothetical protein
VGCLGRLAKSRIASVWIIDKEKFMMLLLYIHRFAKIPLLRCVAMLAA